ncbi:Uncharacterised protein [uncultured archaeon]|nr:Uncharacterised protein [uncultured archaeon]
MTTETQKPIKRNYELLKQTEQKLDWLKRQNNRLRNGDDSNFWRILFANRQYPCSEVDAIEYLPPDPVSQHLESEYKENRFRCYGNEPLQDLRRIQSREMTEKKYDGLINTYGIKPEQPSNPVEERPTIIYSDAKQYKADMQKLAEGLVQRLGAV